MNNNLLKFKKFIVNPKFNIENCKNKIKNIPTQKLCTDNYSFIENNIENCESGNNYSNNTKFTESISNVNFRSLCKNISTLPFLFVISIILLMLCVQTKFSFTRESFSVPTSNNTSNISSDNELSYVPQNNTANLTDDTLLVSSALTNGTLSVYTYSNKITTETKITPMSKYENPLPSFEQNLSTKAISLSTGKTITVEKPKLKFLPDYFAYTDINKSKLRSYLNSRNSKLAEDPYFDSIISVSKEYNLNPLILFAITGQEQSFVPKNNKYATKIANNPYNIYCSWQHYNSDITDSSQIVAKTIINLSEGRPSSVDPFTWINKKYASDQNWGKGVRAIFNMLVDKSK
jgi:hypothetical protein